MINLFKRRNLKEYTDSLAGYLPGDILFASKQIPSSNLRKFLTGLANELIRVNGDLIDYSNEILPDETTKYINEWEKAVGIPDDCFTGIGTNDERRTAILIKLASSGVQTIQDFLDIADLLGVQVTVIPGSSIAKFPFKFDYIFFDSIKDARFTLVVKFQAQEANRFTLTYPIIFGDESIAILECIFKKLKPANCRIIFQQI